MKIRLIGAALLFSASTAFATPTPAPTNTSSLYLAGIIPIVTTISVAPAPGSDSLNLVATASNTTVASVTEQNNTWRGYYVTLQSKHGGNFELEDARRADHFNKIPYSAQYNGVSVKLDRFPRVIYGSSWHNLTSQGRTVPFTVSFDAQNPASLLAGTYSDTLTFMISAR